MEEGKQFVSGHCDSVDTAMEREKQVYPEKRRETLSGYLTTKVNYLEKELSPIGILLENSLSAVAERVKELLTRTRVREDKLSDWQLLLLQSKANGCSRRDEDLPQKNWQWPKNTWFQERLIHHGKELRQ